MTGSFRYIRHGWETYSELGLQCIIVTDAWQFIRVKWSGYNVLYAFRAGCRRNRLLGAGIRSKNCVRFATALRSDTVVARWWRRCGNLRERSFRPERWVSVHIFIVRFISNWRLSFCRNTCSHSSWCTCFKSLYELWRREVIINFNVVRTLELINVSDSKQCLLVSVLSAAFVD